MHTFVQLYVELLALHKWCMVISLHSFIVQCTVPIDPWLVRSHFVNVFIFIFTHHFAMWKGKWKKWNVLENGHSAAAKHRPVLSKPGLSWSLIKTWQLYFLCIHVTVTSFRARVFSESTWCLNFWSNSKIPKWDMPRACFCLLNALYCQTGVSSQHFITVCVFYAVTRGQSEGITSASASRRRRPCHF